MAVKEGEQVPALLLVDEKGRKRNLTALLKGVTILYFYPRDFTSGCTTEAKEFSDLIDEFAALKAQVIGVSPDPPESHVRFRDAHGLAVALFTDPNSSAARAFGAYGEKSLYGKKTTGIIRSTFALDSKGRILKAWRNVRARGHASKVLEWLKAYRQGGG